MSDDGAFLFIAADDGTIPLQPGQTVEEVLAERRDLELHSYYDSIQDLTFPTRFVPVPVEAAEAWRVWNRGGDPESMNDAFSSALRALRLEVDRCVVEVAQQVPDV